MFLDSLSSSKPLPLQKIQQQIDENVACIVYYLYRDTLVIMVLTQRGIVCSHIKDNGILVDRLVRETFLSDKKKKALIFDTEHEYALKSNLHKLWNLLIAPIYCSVKNFEKVVIIPHGVLFRCAFAALFDGDSYLIEKHALSFAPSASIYALCRSKRLVKLDTCIAFGYKSENLQGVAPLPCAELEAKNIFSIFGKNGLCFLGENASKTNFEKHFFKAEDFGALGKKPQDSFDVLHMAAHYRIFDENPLISHFLLYGDGETPSFLYTEEIPSYNLSLSLVTLSACSSAGVKVFPGGDILGISAAFFVAGTASLLLNLWEVNDWVAENVMNTFYRVLIKGKNGRRLDKAESLRATLLEMVEGGEHPMHWAGYLMLGDYRID